MLSRAGSRLVAGIYRSHPALVYAPATHQPLRFYSAPQRKGFLGNLIDNVKDELERNKELHVSLAFSSPQTNLVSGTPEAATAKNAGIE